MFRSSTLSVVLIVFMAGLEQCQGAPGLGLFSDTGKIFQDFMTQFQTNMKQKNLGTQINSDSPSNLPTSENPFLKTSTASPIKNLRIPIETEMANQDFGISLRSGFSENEIDEVQPPETKKTHVQQLFKGGPIYEYEIMYVRVPNSRSRLNAAFDNNLETSASEIDSKYIIKEIMVPIKRIKGGS